MFDRGLIYFLYRISEWVFRFSMMNILWVVVNLPIIYLIFNLFVAKTPDVLLVNLVILAILAPFVFFPATSGLFGVVRKWIMGKHDISMFRSFFTYYKENYFRSVAGGLVLVPLWIVLIIDYLYFSSGSTPLLYLFLASGMFMFVFSLHFISNTVHVHLTFLQSLKNSFLLAVGRPVYTIGITAACVTLFFISYKAMPFLFLLGIGSLIAYVSFYMYYRAITP